MQNVTIVALYMQSCRCTVLMSGHMSVTIHMSMPVM